MLDLQSFALPKAFLTPAEKRIPKELGYHKIEVTAAPACAVPDVDNEVIHKLRSFAVTGYEHGATFICATLPNVAGFVDSIYATNSFALGNTQDPCSVALTVDSEMNTSGLGHTHPFFTSNTEYRRGVGCHKDKSWQTPRELSSLNNRNRFFSGTDKETAKKRTTAYYLASPLRDAVKVIREGSQPPEEIYP